MIVICSSDSGYLKIVKQAKKHNKLIVLCGNNDTNRTYRNFSDCFYNTCLNTYELNFKKINSIAETFEIIFILRIAISNCKKKDGKARLSDIGTYLCANGFILKRKYQGINTLSALLRFLGCYQFRGIKANDLEVIAD